MKPLDPIQLIKKLSIPGIILFISIFINSCENPMDNGSFKALADAGADQVTYVGSYAILDASKSMIDEKTIDNIMWIQDLNNPDEIFAFNTALKDTTYAGFVKEGDYKFTLQITCKNGDIHTDDLMITVKPGQISDIEDINLEARIRQILKYRTGSLTADKLELIDSLSNYDFPLKNKIKEISGIEYCTNVKHLALGNENISDISLLSGLIKLEYLDLNQNYAIEDISSLHNLTHLKKLVLDSNPIKDITSLENLTELEKLYLMFVPVTYFNSLRNLANLKLLYISGVGEDVTFDSIDPIGQLTNLKRLILCGGNITDITPLENLTELIELNVGYNKFISNISAVSNMTKLIRLYIENNRINDITGIKNLQNLDWLAASDNQIKDISELQYLPKVHLLGLSENQIEDLLPLVNNPYLGEGVELYISGNPLSEKSINEYIPILRERGVRVYRFY